MFITGLFLKLLDKIVMGIFGNVTLIVPDGAGSYLTISRATNDTDLFLNVFLGVGLILFYLVGLPLVSEFLAVLFRMGS